MTKETATEYRVSGIAVKKLMRKAREISRHIDKSFVAPPSGWHLSSFDPNPLIDSFSCIQIRDGFRLAVKGGASKKGKSYPRTDLCFLSVPSGYRYSFLALSLLGLLCLIVHRKQKCCITNILHSTHKRPQQKSTGFINYNIVDPQ